jgi:hypothetical protein
VDGAFDARMLRLEELLALLGVNDLDRKDSLALGMLSAAETEASPSAELDFFLRSFHIFGGNQMISMIWHLQ